MDELTLIIGAGSSGVAAAYHLKKKGIPFRIVEEGHVIGEHWLDRKQFIRLTSPRDVVGLPDYPVPDHFQDHYLTFPDYAKYLDEYARRFDIPVEVGIKVVKARRLADQDAWEVTLTKRADERLSKRGSKGQEYPAAGTSSKRMSRGAASDPAATAAADSAPPDGVVTRVSSLLRRISIGSPALPINANKEAVASQSASSSASKDTEVIRVKNLVIATGKYTRAAIPDFAGKADFQGQILHSSQVTDMEGIGKKNKAMIIGLGNSGIELGMLLIRKYEAPRVVWAVRRVPCIMPMKLVGRIELTDVGFVTDLLPDSVNKRIIKVMQYGIYGEDVRKYFPPELPEWTPWEVGRIPSIDRYNFFDAVKAGQAVIKPNVKRLLRRGVEFDDGTVVEDIDMVICATGMTETYDEFVSVEDAKHALFVGFSRKATNPINYAIYEASQVAQHIRPE